MTTTSRTAAAADGRAVVVTAAGSRAPSGRALTGPVDSIDKIAVLAEWAWKHGALAPLSQSGDRSDGQLVPQIWFVGTAACARLGWTITAPDGLAEMPLAQRRAVVRSELAATVAASLAPLIGAGWIVHGGGHRIRLTRTTTVDVELIIATTIAGVETCSTAVSLPDDDEAAADELGRRLGVWWSQLRVLPTGTGAGTGAAVLDRIRHDRQSRNQGLVATGPGTVPAEVLAGLVTEVQPRWARIVEDTDIDLPGGGPPASVLVELDQDSGLLASAGMLTLPVGAPELHAGAPARDLAASSKRPFALWQITLPASAGLDLPTGMPAPDPRMQEQTPVRVWVTSAGLQGLLAPATHGGLGVELDELEITAAVSWAKQGRALDKWAAELRGALDAFTAAGDTASAAIAADAWRDYLPCLADPHPWQGENLAHHLQPVWWAAMCELTRFRSRKAMLRIAREFRVYPLMVQDTTVVYAVDPAMDLSDAPGNRGRHEVRRTAALSTDEDLVALLMPLTPDGVAAAIDTALGRPVHHEPTSSPEPGPDLEGDMPSPQLSEPDRLAPSDRSSESEPAAEPDTSSDRTAASPEAATASTAPSTAEAPASGTSPKHAPRGRSAAKADSRFVGPAAVLDVSGAWLADGSCVPLPDNVVHVGDLAEFAYTLRLGHPLSPTHAEEGQIWITDALARRFGIDPDVVSRSSRGEDLRRMTSTLPLVTLAVAAGWQIEVPKNGTVVGLGNWTRVSRPDDERPKIMVVLMAGLADRPEAVDPDMPILGGDPSPEVVARRLKLFADTLQFPLKISAPTTGIDLMKEARPNTYGPREWWDRVWAPTQFEPPHGIRFTARDFTWTRTPTPQEAACRYCHAYDRGGSYVAGLGGTELPIGEPVHMQQGQWAFDASTPALILTTIPPASTWQLPHVLSPAGRDFGDTPEWVCTPQFQQALDLGYELAILEAWVWPEHGRLLREWAARFSTAARILDTEDPDDQAVRKQAKTVRVRGYGMLASNQLVVNGVPRTPYSRAKWSMGVSKATANIARFVNTMLDVSDVGILAVLKDTIVIASDDPDPVTAWPMADYDAQALAANPRHRVSLGRGFGQWKPEASGYMTDQLQYFTGGPYRGKSELHYYQDWSTRMAEGNV